MPIQTPICDFGQKAYNFELKSTDNKILSLNDVKGENGTLIMFICNHCPYVKAVTKDIVEDCNELKKIGINSVAICANDAENYPEDSFDNMIEFAKKNKFSFPYLNDVKGENGTLIMFICNHCPYVKAVTKDIVEDSKKLIPVRDGDSDLLKAMIQIAETNKGPENQIPSAGCGIKWKTN